MDTRDTGLREETRNVERLADVVTIITDHNKLN